MFKIDDLLEQVQNEQESLALLSAAGFKASDWHTLKKLGSCKALLKSDLIFSALEKNCTVFSALPKIIKNFRKYIDLFYQNDGFLLGPYEEEWESFFKVPQAPLVFFGRFAKDVLKKKPSIAIVGSRKADQLGQSTAEKLAFNLGEQGINIISGGALGIDSAAHRGALRSGGSTVIVSGLACSFECDEWHKLVSLEHRQRCAVLYPFAPWISQAKHMFVNRNSFVVGLSNALVVVQGSNGSGTLHSARFAESQKIPIFAVPGSINNPLSFAPNELIASGKAKALVDLGANPLEIDLKKKSPKNNLENTRKNNKPASQLPDLLRLIHENGNAMSMPEIVAKAGKPFLEIQRELLSYELKGQLLKRGPQFVLTLN